MKRRLRHFHNGGFFFIPLVFAVGGGIIGGAIGGGAIAGIGISAMFGMTGTAIGSMLGMMAGSVLANMLFPQENETQWPQLDEYPIQKSTNGPPIQVVLGTRAVAGNVVWEGEVQAYEVEHSAGGKGGDMFGKGGSMEETRYRQSFLISICEGPASVLRISANGKEIWPDPTSGYELNIRKYLGESVDATIFEGIANQGITDLTGEDYGQWPHDCCIFFKDYELGNYKTKPNFVFEIASQIGYPLLFSTDVQNDPSLPHTTPITNVTELQAMNTDRSGNYYLTKDIDASLTATWNGGAGFIPIGTAASPFTGTLDGCGYTITGLTINRNAYAQSLLGYVEGPAKVANLTLASVDIKCGIYYGGSLAGNIATGGSNVLIQNCHSSGTITKHASAAGMGYYGGLIGYARQTSGAGLVYIYDCSTSCELDMTSCNLYLYRGGFIGYLQDGFVQNCYATGDLSNGPGSQTGNTEIGGFVGFLNISTVSFCYATGDVVNADSIAGGFGGSIENNCTLNSCYATGNVSAAVQNAGGFAGSINSGTAGTKTTIQDCYAWGSVTSPNLAGGFVGSATQARDEFINCYSIGLITASTNFGGFDGSSNVSTTFTACFWDTETSGQETTDGDAIGHVTEWMKTRPNYVAAGWDFDIIWYMGFSSGDMNFAEMCRELLTNKQWGVGLSASTQLNTSTFDSVKNYCTEQNLIGSIVIDEQRSWRDWIDYICSHFGGYWYESGGLICLGVYRDSEPAAILDEASGDFRIEDGKDPPPPIKIRDREYSETCNRVLVTWTDRDNDYNLGGPVAANDETDQRISGQIRSQTYDLRGICNAALAQRMAYRLLIDAMYRFKAYNFTVPYKWMLLEPGDVITISGRPKIAGARVRIFSVAEEARGRGIEIVAVEDISGLYPDIAFGVQGSLRTALPTVSIYSGTVNFREDVATNQLYLSITPGGAYTNGWYIYRSYDDATYDLIGRCGISGVTGGSANSKGTISGSLAAHGSTTWAPDESVLVNIGTVTDLHTDITDAQFWGDLRLARIGGETIAFLDAAETAVPGVWLISNLRRGCFGTEALAHTAGEAFCTLDSNFLYRFSEADIGRTLYFKALTYYGDITQNIASVSSFSVTIQGYYKRPAAASLLRLTSDQNDGGSGEYSGSSFTLYWNLGSRVSGYNYGGYDVSGGGVPYGNYTADDDLEAVVLRFEQADETAIGEREIAVGETATITKSTDLGGNNPARVMVVPRRVYESRLQNVLLVDDGT